MISMFFDDQVRQRRKKFEFGFELQTSTRHTSNPDLHVPCHAEIILIQVMKHSIVNEMLLLAAAVQHEVGRHATAFQLPS